MTEHIPVPTPAFPRTERVTTTDKVALTEVQLAKWIDEHVEIVPSGEHDRDGLAIAAWDEVEERETEWLELEQIPCGELTLTTGRGDLGKSTLEADRIARATRGDLSGEPVRVLHIAEGEVGAERAKAMLRAAGADGSMVTFDKPRSLLTIPNDVGRLTTTIRRGDYGLVSFDNIEAHIELGGADPYSENAIRRRDQPAPVLRPGDRRRHHRDQASTEGGRCPCP